ncbi:hypothetical protein STEG23_008436 [Scotinomys teguina]
MSSQGASQFRTHNALKKNEVPSTRIGQINVNSNPRGPDNSVIQKHLYGRYLKALLCRVAAALAFDDSTPEAEAGGSPQEPWDLAELTKTWYTNLTNIKLPFLGEIAFGSPIKLEACQTNVDGLFPTAQSWHYTNEVVQLVKVLAAKPNDLSPFPGTQMETDENGFLITSRQAVTLYHIVTVCSLRTTSRQVVTL